MNTKGVAVTAGTGSALAVGGAGTYYYVAQDARLRAKEKEKSSEEVEAIKYYLKLNKDLYLSNFTWTSLESTNDAWKTFSHRGICSGTLFPNLIKFDEGADASNVSVFSEATYKRADGCVAINWQQTKENSKWKGSIRVEWVLKKGSDALISLAALKNSDSGNNVDIYLKTHSLNLEGETWSVKNTKEHTVAPLTSDFIKDENNNYWGFVLDKANACGWNNTSSPANCNITLGAQDKTTTTTKIYQWWEDEEAPSPRKFSSWSKNFTSWWNSYLKAAFDLNEKEKLAGIWREIV